MDALGVESVERRRVDSEANGPSVELSALRRFPAADEPSAWMLAAEPAGMLPLAREISLDRRPTAWLPCRWGASEVCEASRAGGCDTAALEPSIGDDCPDGAVTVVELPVSWREPSPGGIPAVGDTTANTEPDVGSWLGAPIANGELSDEVPGVAAPSSVRVDAVSARITPSTTPCA